MRAYQLVHKEYQGDVIFGLPFPYNQLDGEKKINYLVSKFKPWKHCIPYYKNSKFAFVSLDALKTFLYEYSKLTKQEETDIQNNFYINSFDLNTWSSGLSKFLCTYFDDEIEEGSIETLEFDDIKNIETCVIYQDSVPKEDIKINKEEYYSNIKTYY